MRDVQKDIAQMHPVIYSLHRGRSLRALVCVIPAGELYRIAWPDGTLSWPANLTRCKAAAIEWAEQNAMTKHRNLSVAQRLKLLANFSWSWTYVTQNGLAA
jgi:hypothetical protein